MKKEEKNQWRTMNHNEKEERKKIEVLHATEVQKNLKNVLLLMHIKRKRKKNLPCNKLLLGMFIIVVSVYMFKIHSVHKTVTFQ